MAQQTYSATGLPATVDQGVQGQVAAQQATVKGIEVSAASMILASWGSLQLSNLVSSWFERGIGNEIYATLSTAQLVAANTAHDYVQATTARQGRVAAVPQVDPQAFAGVASDGRDLDDLLFQSVVHVMHAQGEGADDQQAMAHGQDFLERVIQVQVADAAREATQAVLTSTDLLGIDIDIDDDPDFDELERLIYREVDNDTAAQTILTDLEQIINDAAQREVVSEADRVARHAASRNPRVAAGRAPELGWVRVLTPPSCSRCVLLAGRWYRWSEHFYRHDNCDCIHVVSTREGASEFVVKPGDYFDSLTPSQQVALFGRSQSEAIRDGADPTQVINATTRKGALYSVDGVQYTREGTSKRGEYRRNSSAGKKNAARLTPAEIYRQAGDDRNEARRLLRSFGYITGPVGQE